MSTIVARAQQLFSTTIAFQDKIKLKQRQKKSNKINDFIKFAKKRNMNSNGIYQKYIKIIEQILLNSTLTKEDLLNKFNSNLMNIGIAQKTSKTIERIISQMKIIDGYSFEIGYEGHQRTYRLISTPEKLVLTTEEINSFPLIFGLMQWENIIPPIKKIKELIKTEYGLSNFDVDTGKYFVKSEPEINNHDKILLLAGKIINFAKNGIVIKYNYKNKEGKEDYKYVAPLQIRFYDHRYYLLGIDVDSETGLPSNVLKNYSLDTFLNYQIEEAFKEPEDGIFTNEIITFNHEEWYIKSDLKNKLKNSLGIWYFEDNINRVYRLKFYDWAKNLVLNRKIHHSQKVIENKDNYVILQITICNKLLKDNNKELEENPELSYILGRFGDKCERLN